MNEENDHNRTKFSDKNFEDLTMITMNKIFCSLVKIKIIKAIKDHELEINALTLAKKAGIKYTPSYDIQYLEQIKLIDVRRTQKEIFISSNEKGRKLAKLISEMEKVLDID